MGEVPSSAVHAFGAPVHVTHLEAADGIEEVFKRISSIVLDDGPFRDFVPVRRVPPLCVWGWGVGLVRRSK